MKRSGNMSRFAVLLTFMLVYGTATLSTIAKQPDIKGGEATNKDSYLALVAHKCRQTYFPLADYDRCKTVVQCRLSCDGGISDIKLLQPPKDLGHNRRSKLADDSVVYAVKTLAPLPKPPVEVPCPIVVRITFDGRNTGPMRVFARFNDEDSSTDKRPKVGQTRAKRT